MGKYAEAEPLFKQSLTITEKALGPENPNVTSVLENYADLLRKTGRDDEAAEMEARAEAIRAKHAQ
ncbi:MAG: tetratricopeptide repeat protein [Acidobacteria bacterium]|nr:tetratricopeptide repeat protein [Acidobacteriota bacterium]MCH8267479.1 tetratricopeptide repeat protein [Acidobacteriota bacterium]MCZ6490151.1 tetratricopeptide repeat protein [Acidobacteriota bacterium]MCZ6750206.1 tetratricopeptide repeat protein [Acidobacteriota bacterium]